MLLCSRNPGSGVGVGSSPALLRSARVPLGAASAGTFADCAALRDSGGGALQLLLIQEGDSHKCSLDGGRSARARAVFCIAERRVTHAVYRAPEKGFPRSGPRGCFFGWSVCSDNVFLANENWAFLSRRRLDSLLYAVRPRGIAIHWLISWLRMGYMNAGQQGPPKLTICTNPSVTIIIRLLGLIACSAVSL
ncbi:hypothetical protein MRX96_015148 [Rhipicephalus microplus]